MSVLAGKRILIVAGDHPASGDLVALTRRFSEAGAEVGVWSVPGAERWFGAAALAHLSETGARCVAPVAPDWAADAALLLGDTADASSLQTLRADLVLCSPDPAADNAPLSWAVPVAARALSSGALRGRSVLVTAGPTVEHFDAVRFLSNPSSGKMGYAVAAAAWEAGADVTLVSGPTSLQAPFGVSRVQVESAAQMRDAVLASEVDIVFKAAAVSDYRPAARQQGKVKKSAGPWTLEMERTPDILAELSISSSRPSLLIGFAAETDALERYAREKLRAKALDGIVANDVGQGGAFGSDSNRVECYDAGGGAVAFGPAPKPEVATAIVAWAASLLARKQ